MAARRNDTDPRALIGQRVRQVRLRLGLSQKAFAEAVGASEGSVGLWERGKARPEMHLSRLATVAGVSEAWILYGNEGPAIDRDAGTLVDRVVNVERLMIGVAARVDHDLTGFREQMDETARMLKRLDAQGDRIEGEMRELHTDAFTSAAAPVVRRSQRRAEGKSARARSRRRAG